MNQKIALQLYSVRDQMQQEFEGTLEQVKEIGYEGIEFAGLFEKSPSEIRKMLERIGLCPMSAHVPLLDLIAQPEQVFAAYQEIGCRYLAIPYLTPEYRPGGGRFEQVIVWAKMLGEMATRYNMTLLYHNHDFEFETVQGEYVLDLLYRLVPSNLLQTEIDTCWVHVAGENPCNYLKKYTNRAPVVHLKDFVMPGKKPKKLYQLIGIENSEQDDGDIFEFRPLGYGAQDMCALLQACGEVGAEWVVVEQDAPSLHQSSMKCAQMSMETLQKLIGGK